MKLVIVLPTYNERENIVTLLTGLRRVTKSVKKFTIEYLVVDDTSPDGTSEEVCQYQKKYRDIFLLSGKKEGLGKAMLRGVAHAIERMKADFILQMDADLSHDPAAVPQFLEALDHGADFVVGSRYIPGGSIPDNWGIHRKLFSVVGNAIVRFSLGFPSVHDWTGGFRAYHKKYFEMVRSELTEYKGYVFQIAFLHKSILRGAKIHEVPIHFTDRRFGRSKIAPAEYIRNVLWYVAAARFYRTIHSPFPKFLVVGTVGFIINTLVLEIAVKLGFHPAAGSAIGAELAIVSNFLFNNGWTFRHRKIKEANLFFKFLQFNGTSVGAILIQAGTVFAGTHLSGISSYRLFYILGVFVGLFWNYMMYSRVIWARH